MQEGKFIQTILHMQNVKRWAEYRPHFSDNAASHSFRVAAYATIAVLVEEKFFGNELDKFHVVGKALFHDLNDTITGSIKHRTKKDSLVREYIRNFEREASIQIVGYLPEEVREIYNVLVIDAEDNSTEGQIVNAIDTFDALMFCYRETLYGSNPIFRLKFAELYEELREVPIQSVQWLMDEFDKKEEVYEFLNHILMLETVDRWNGKFNLIPDEDAKHTFRAASLAVFNGIYEKTFHEKEINMFELTGKTIFHDLVEGITGDVKGPLKHSTPETKKAFEEYEKRVSEMMVESLPVELRASIKTLLVDAKNDTYEGYMVDVSDKLDALIKSKLESIINPQYVATYTNQLQKMNRRFKNESIIYFLDEIVSEISLGMID